MTRTDWLTDRFKRYLDRRTMPQGLKDKPKAQVEEIQALIARLLKDAPGQGYQDWWDDFSDTLAANAQTRAWPTEFEIARAAKDIRSAHALTKPKFVTADTADDGQQRIDMISARIKAGQAIGESYLYGRDCVELLDRAFVTEEDLKPYRSSLFFTFRDVYGEDEAKAREAKLWEKHRQALAAKRARA